MNNLINLLQTIALLLGTVIVILAMGWAVYAFSKIAMAFEELLRAIKQPHVSVHTASVTTTGPQVVIEKVAAKSVPVAAVRYLCKTCEAKLPEMPTHSEIRDGITLLIFKCRRCAKETKVDPEKTEPVQKK